MISKDEWVRVTSKLIGSVSDVFKPKEILILYDFLQTVKEDVEKVQKKR